MGNQTKKTPIKKQAVLLIHGIGEQRPMDTLRNFVRAVWTEATSLHRDGKDANKHWSKPYLLSESLELRRLTTPANKAGIRTDFFELYWAHLMHGSTLSHVASWARTLLLRRPGAVPRQLRLAYWTIILLLVVGVFFAYEAVAATNPFLSKWQSTVLSVVVVPIIAGVLTNTVGDAARYLNPSPTNVGRREEIRQLGVDVLRSLNDPKNGYDRVVVVGHSLGSVIGYDILYYTWTQMNQKQHDDASDMEKLEMLEETTRALVDGKAVDVDEFQKQQRDYHDELRNNGNDWRVTDFVTLGSPLAHAAILLAQDQDDLNDKIRSRELASCPPELETSLHKPPKRLFSYPANAEQRTPHHAALYGPTRWANLYFPARFLVWGDIVGGPLRAVFGNGIKDRAVSIKRRGGFLSHTLYWSPNGKGSYNSTHLKELRDALDLLCNKSNAPREHGVASENGAE